MSQLLYAGPVLAGVTLTDHLHSFDSFASVGDALFSSVPARVEGHRAAITYLPLPTIVHGDRDLKPRTVLQFRQSSCLHVASILRRRRVTRRSSRNLDAPSLSRIVPAEESPETTTDSVITPAACFVTLNFCDRPNSAVGTDCTQSGCSLTQARSVCKSIVSDVGCNIHCNAVTRNSSGTILETWRVRCGTTCCPEGNFCGSGGQCCDGTCKPGCPC
jgi:hypothetical protein